MSRFFTFPLIVILVTLSASLFSKITFASPPSINIATIDYPPLMGAKEGLMTDIVREAFLTQSYRVNFTLIPMARIAWSITESDSDAAIGSIHWFRGQPTLDQVVFSTIYYTGMHFFYRKAQFPNEIIYNQLSELKHYNIGYIQSGSMLNILNDAGIKPELVKDLATNTKKLKNERIDMFVATELGGWGAIRKLYPNQMDQFAMTTRPILDIIGSGDIVFPKKNKALKKLFILGLSTIKKNGRFIELLEQYYGKGNIPAKLLTFAKEA